MADRHILLIITGGIAAYKALELIRQLREKSIKVTPVLTKSAHQFVTPLSVSALAAQKVYSDLFDLTDEAEMGHIELSRAANLVVVAPASADFLAKIALGQANDLASTLVLATDKPILVAPAMNVKMWESAACQRNVNMLRQDGVRFVGPDNGSMACGDFGPGRMAEPSEITEQIESALSDGPLCGRHVVITSGPTHEPIDPVRYIANRSSGAQGTALAKAFVQLGAHVTFISGPASAALPDGVTLVKVTTAREMLRAVEVALPADVAIFAAAVADWHVTSASTQKIKKQSNGALPALTFAENPDILATISQRQSERPKLVIGFAAETNDVVENATFKRIKKGCDWIIANDVRPETDIMGGDENLITLITDQGQETWSRMKKTAVAEQIANRVSTTLGQEK